jgi:hypothetical protein
MIEMLITVILGTGIVGDTTIVKSISKKIIFDASTYTTCRNLVIDETKLNEKDFDNKALLYICDLKKSKFSDQK